MFDISSADCMTTLTTNRSLSVPVYGTVRLLLLSLLWSITKPVHRLWYRLKLLNIYMKRFGEYTCTSNKHNISVALDPHGMLK